MPAPALLVLSLLLYSLQVSPNSYEEKTIAGISRDELVERNETHLHSRQTIVWRNKDLEKVVTALKLKYDALKIDNSASPRTLIIEGASGTVPTELWDITSLTTLKFSKGKNNRLTGFSFPFGNKVPTMISKLSLLRTLELNPGFADTWTIPTQITSLRNLRDLQISDCIFESGPLLPTELGLMKGLWSFDFDPPFKYRRIRIPSEIGLISDLSTRTLR
eukprot:TRINITY_DN5898_c0_g1_i1.p1 TRINITY_DN5898_c0_g1~~TRINITY_DN5898_c0_g1_i1.p1  ORF type:complete len:232 (+),score=51.47 TRINITY_DN5898_c0_g1_i1:40-696(+)